MFQKPWSTFVCSPPLLSSAHVGDRDAVPNACGLQCFARQQDVEEKLPIHIVGKRHVVYNLSQCRFAVGDSNALEDSPDLQSGGQTGRRPRTVFLSAKNLTGEMDLARRGPLQQLGAV